MGLNPSKLKLALIGLGGPGLMWALSEFGFTWPPEIVVLAGIGFGAMLIVAALIWLRDAYKWLRAKPREHPQMGAPQILLIAGITGTWLCLTMALGAAAWIVWRGSGFGLTTVAHTTPATAASQAEVVLLPPDERHEIVWNPVKVTGIATAKEGKVELGKWSVPQFHLRSTNGVAANDAQIEWRADIKGLTDLVKNSPRLKDQIDIRDEKIYIKGRPDIPSHVYYLKDHISYQVPFITTAQPGAVAVIPFEIFSQLELYVVSLLPNDLGEELGPFPFSAKVTWTLPTPGTQEYRVDAVAKNVNAPGISEPVVNAVVQFSVKRIN